MLLFLNINYENSNFNMQTTAYVFNYFSDENDYSPLRSFSVVIPVGESKKCFVLNIIDDISFEENETLTLSLQKPKGSHLIFDDNLNATVIVIESDDRKLYKVLLWHYKSN